MEKDEDGIRMKVLLLTPMTAQGREIDIPLLS